MQENPLTRRLGHALAGLALISLIGCSGEFYREAGAEVDEGGFGNPTMTNSQLMAKRHLVNLVLHWAGIGIDQDADRRVWRGHERGIAVITVCRHVAFAARSATLCARPKGCMREPMIQTCNTASREQ